LRLKYREKDLDLIQPAGVKWEVDHHRVGMSAAEPGGGDCAAMRTAVVYDPEDSVGRAIGFALHDLVDEAAEGLDASLGFKATEQLGSVKSQAAR
jgi:hypothetical protein